MLGDVGAADDLVGVQDEMFEQRILTRGQRQRLPETRTRRARVSSSSGPTRRITGVGGLAPAANDGPESGEQFTEVERLGQVVVRATVQAAIRASTASRAVSINTGTAIPLA